MSEEIMPLLSELDELARVYKRGIGHVVVIDDISTYAKANGYSLLSEVIGKLEKIDPSLCFFFDYDMFYALPNENNPSVTHSFWRNVVYHFVVR
jgi:hypothetical protein